ncbi:hypothetical protein BDP27DRAFT_1294272 [Rhodocollybia butyracea]|uniref:Pre-rRNA-processing protein n=1 Tax=Rhodocollybia butyracea TaxID=206335 RepID=A0A9P5U6R6_9AGAR|nr:hypothetical protein BDP27DRAFT_1294272 [Rhodocollybia butyracea]
MPKSAKRRKEKAADFAKAKLKLGKGKQAPSNAIDTSFKARSIALPSQSIAIEKDGSAPTTRRKLSFDDLLVNVKHHNPGTRKDTIFGFRELLDAHWDLIKSSLPVLVNTTVRIIGDEDASVRKALLSFYSWLIPRIPKEDLAPHAPLILLFTTSAQTHIFPEIRVDAVRFLNIFLEYFPEIIVSGWDTANNSHGSRVLEGYLGVLSAGTITGDDEGPPVATSTASVMLTPASKLVVLQSLSRFLKAATESRSAASISDSTWFLSSSFTTVDAYNAFSEILLPPHLHPRPSPSKPWCSETDSQSDNFPISSSLASDAGIISYHLQELSESLVSCRNICEAGASTSSGNPLIVRLATTLHPTLVSVFLDCAPAVFSPSDSPPETEMELISAVVSITNTLYGVINQDSTPAPSALDELKTILGYMSPFFPFHPSGRRDVKVEEIFQDLNLIYCDLTSRLVLSSRTETAARPTTLRGKKGRQLGNDALQADRVHEYVLQFLRGQVSDSQLVRTLTPAAYNSLLPTIWSLINYSGRNQDYIEQSVDVLKATVEHAVKTGSKSALKRSTFDFVARLVLLETDVRYNGNFRLGTSAEVDQALEEWLTQLPQVLWELGGINPSASEAIVLFLLRMLQRRSRLLNENTLTCLQTRLTPYFHITHPTRGTMRGPFAKLTGFSSPCLGLRRRVLDFVALLMVTQGGPSCIALKQAAESALIDRQEQEYWAHLKRCFAL